MSHHHPKHASPNRGDQTHRDQTGITGDSSNVNTDHQATHEDLRQVMKKAAKVLATKNTATQFENGEKIIDCLFESLADAFEHAIEYLDKTAYAIEYPIEMVKSSIEESKTTFQAREGFHPYLDNDLALAAGKEPISTHIGAFCSDSLGVFYAAYNNIKSLHTLWKEASNIMKSEGPSGESEYQQIMRGYLSQTGRVHKGEGKKRMVSSYNFERLYDKLGKIEDIKNTPRSDSELRKLLTSMIASESMYQMLCNNEVRPSRRGSGGAPSDSDIKIRVHMEDIAYPLNYIWRFLEKYNASGELKCHHGHDLILETRTRLIPILEFLSAYQAILSGGDKAKIEPIWSKEIEELGKYWNNNSFRTLATKFTHVYVAETMTGNEVRKSVNSESVLKDKAVVEELKLHEKEREKLLNALKEIINFKEKLRTQKIDQLVRARDKTQVPEPGHGSRHTHR